MAKWTKHLIPPALALATVLPIACRDSKAIELEKGHYKQTVAHFSTDQEKSDYFATEGEALVKEYLRALEYQSGEQLNAIGSKMAAFSAVAAASSGLPDKNLLEPMYDRLGKIKKNIDDRESGGQYLAQYISDDPALQEEYFRNMGQSGIAQENAISIIRNFERQLGQAVVNAKNYRE